MVVFVLISMYCLIAGILLFGKCERVAASYGRYSGVRVFCIEEGT